MLNLTFSALADPHRRAILEQLATGSRSVGDLQTPFDISGPAVSRHLKVLETSGLVVNNRVGKGRICTLGPTSLQEASEWMDFQARFWSGSLDRLAQFVRINDD
jgi:DNA-binding transcriptional ArsR family regulator